MLNKNEVAHHIKHILHGWFCKISSSWRSGKHIIILACDFRFYNVSKSDKNQDTFSVTHPEIKDSIFLPPSQSNLLIDQ